MKHEAQRRAIAAACGLQVELVRMMKGETFEIPMYLTDLNACHEMEKTLTKEERRQWEFVIADMFNSPGMSWFDVCHATAAQRCEAFLKTIGKWEASRP